MEAHGLRVTVIFAPADRLGREGPFIVRAGFDDLGADPLKAAADICEAGGISTRGFNSPRRSLDPGEATKMTRKPA